MRDRDLTPSIRRIGKNAISAADLNQIRPSSKSTRSRIGRPLVLADASMRRVAANPPTLVVSVLVLEGPWGPLPGERCLQANLRGELEIVFDTLS